MQEFLKIIEKSKLFSGIDILELSTILDCLGAIKSEYKKGDYIFRIGDKISALGIVLSGSAIIVQEDYWGNRTILSEIQNGDIFGESFACTGNGTINVSVIATKDCIVLFLDITRILTTCRNSCTFHTRLVRNLVTVLSDKNIMLSEKIEHISHRKLRNKILSYLSECSKKQSNSSFSIPFSRQELADYLSCDRSALSNELCKLRDERILEFNKNSFKLL